MRWLLLCLIFVGCFSLATVLEPRFQALHAPDGSSSSVIAVLMGDSRRLFANHFYAKADAYFHNGNYPTIFDRQPDPKHSHMSSHAHSDKDEESEEQEEGFYSLGPPHDWIEAFGRHFKFTGHAHLEGNGQEREMLPWLKLTAELDPHRVNTYVTASYWLRTRLGKVQEAEQFLRQGLRANPGNYEILFELGRIYEENKHNASTARNLWQMALETWQQEEALHRKPDGSIHIEILGCLVRLEQREGNLSQLLIYLQELKHASPNPEAIEQQIQETKAKLAAASPSTPSGK